MTERLTQRDIDALLQGTVPLTGGAASDEVVPFNFLQPPRVSKDRRTLLQTIYGRFALSVQSHLSSRLRCPMDVAVSSVEQATFGEFLLSLGAPCAAFVFRSEGGNGGYGVIDLGTGFSFYLIDRLFGGPGEPTRLRRAVTPLEQSVVRGVAERILGLLKDAWEDYLPLAPELVGFESNPDALQVTSREENVLIANIEVRSGAFRGFTTVALPMSMLEAFLQTATPSVHNAPAHATPNRVQVESGLRHVRLAVSVRMPPLWLSARTLARLEVGQVLPTRQPPDGVLEVHVNGQSRFLGTLGQVRRRLGLRITQRLAPSTGVRPAPVRQEIIS